MSIEQNLELFCFGRTPWKWMDGWTPLSGTGLEKQAISIHSVKLQSCAKSTPDLFPMLQEAVWWCCSGVLEWVFSAEWEQSPDHGHSTRESVFTLGFTWGKLCLRVEGRGKRDTGSKLLIAESTGWKILSVCGHCQRHDLEGLTAQREPHSNPDRAVKQVIDVIQYFPKNLVLVCDFFEFLNLSWIQHIWMHGELMATEGFFFGEPHCNVVWYTC